MNVEHILADFPMRRDPRCDETGDLHSVEHDLAVGPGARAELDLRMYALPFAEARSRWPNDHKAWVGFDGTRWVKIDAKFTEGSTRWPRWKAIWAMASRPRGPIIVVTGPDGAGKTTLIETLHQSIPAQVRTHYLGRRRERPASSRRVPEGSEELGILGREPISSKRPGVLRECAFVLRWAAIGWIRLGRVKLDSRLGAVVLCDRHPVEARARQRRIHRLAHRLEQAVTPRGSGTDLMILLSRDPDVFHRRKPEHDPDTLERMIAELRSALPATAAEIDATASQTSVALQAAACVHDAWRRTTTGAVRSLPALAEELRRPCVLIDPTGATPVQQLAARFRLHQLIRIVGAVAVADGSSAERLELGSKDQSPLFSRSRLRRGPVAVRLRSGQPTVLDLSVAASGLDEPGEPRLGAGGGLAVRGRQGERLVLLRVGETGTPADPSHHAAGLVWAAKACVAAPELLGAGHVQDHCWSLESWVEGSAAPVTTDRAPVIEAWIRSMIDVRRRPRRSTLPDAQREELVAHFPRFRGQLDELGAKFDETLAALGSGPAHGDLWAGNLRFADGGAVPVDWDAWSDRAVVGLDLVHCHFEQQRRSAGRRTVPLGGMLQQRPWAAPELSSALRSVAGDLGAGAPEAISYAVWLNSAANTLRRSPSLRWSERWVADNIVGGLRAFDLA